MNHRLAGIISPLGHITTDPIRSSAKPPSSVYYKTIINHLKSLAGIEVLPGLSNEEISAVESSLGFSFPHDLRSILQTGLPVGINFPNWRTRSTRNHLLLPLLHLSKLVRNGFWIDTWGIRPENDEEIFSIVKKLTEFAPVMVPVYGDFYVPSTNFSENQVFQIDGDGVRVLNCDVAMLLQGLGQSEFATEKRLRRRRRVEFWSDVAEKGKFIARDTTRFWWSVLACEGLRTCLDEAFWKLKEGGWTEEEIRDMMLMDGVDEDTCNLTVHQEISRDVVYAFDGGLNTCTVNIDQRKHGEVTTLGHLLHFDRWMDQLNTS